MSTIVRLEIENVMRVKAANIKPSPTGLVIIGGLNGAGKSTVLNSIVMALGGSSEVPPMPVRQGASRSKIVVETDDLVVTKKISAAGSTTLEVRGRDGKVFPSPQSVLDKLYSTTMVFDPLEFLRMEPSCQVETLRKLLGIDTTNLDYERTEKYAARTEESRSLKALQARLDSYPHHENAPSKEVSASEVVAEMQQANKVLAANARKRSEYEQLVERGKTQASLVERLKVEYEAALKVLEEQRAQVLQMRDAIAALKDPDMSAIQKRFESIDSANRKFRDNKAYAEALGEVNEKRQSVDAMTKRLREIDDEKNNMVRNAKYPIEGLGLGDGKEVTYKSLPLSQASFAEQLRISVAIGLALSKGLKVMLIREGSMLDDQNRAMVAEMAEKAGAQLWLEVVGKGKDCSVIIEDGSVVEESEEKTPCQTT